MTYDFRNFDKISGFSVYSNNHETGLDTYHPPKYESRGHSSTLITDHTNEIVKITNVGSRCGNPLRCWDQKSAKIMESLDLNVSRYYESDSGKKVVTEVCDNRLNFHVTGPYVLDSYHVKVDSFAGRKAYLEILGWMELDDKRQPIVNDDDIEKFKSYITGMVKIGDDKAQLYYFDLKKIFNNELDAKSLNDDDIFPVKRFFTTDWYWVNNE